MSDTAYKALGFAVWRGGLWYARHRYGTARRIGTGALAAGAMALAGAAALARRRNGGH
jgi:hypothetical protein